MVAQRVYYVKVKDCLKQFYTTKKWTMNAENEKIERQEVAG